jgi:hypothetical protein
MSTLLLCIPLAGFGAHAQPNLLTNPGFEQGTEGWARWGEGADGVRFARAREGRTDGWAACVAVAPEAAINWYQWQQTVAPAPVADTYRIWGWVRAESVGGGTGVCVSLRANDAEGRRMAFADSQRVGGTRGWTLVWAELSVPAGAATIGVSLTLHGRGRALFDGLGLVERLEESPERVRQRWLEMRERGEWLLIPTWQPGSLGFVTLTPDQAWAEGRPFGWEQPPQGQVRPDGLLLEVPSTAKWVAALRMEVPPGQYGLHLWLGGDCGARIPLDIAANGRALAQRVFPIRAEVLSFAVKVEHEGLRVSFGNACRPLPFGPNAAAPALKAVSITREGNEPADLTGTVRAHQAVREAAVSPVATPMPALPRSTLVPVYAGEIAPEEIGRLAPREALELRGAPGETVSGGALAIGEPDAPFAARLEGSSASEWLRLLVGVPGWTRLAGLQRWDVWHSPARWFEEGSRGRCSPEGLGVVWLRARLPADARPGLQTTTLTVKLGDQARRVPVRVRVLPLELPEPEADLGVFYNSSLNLSCPDDELYKRWGAHLADMREQGMNSVFVYTHRMLWHEQTEAGPVWQDEALREFLRLYSRLFSRPLYLCVHGDRYHPQGYSAYCRHVQDLASGLGVEVVFMPADEAFVTEERLKVAQAEVQMAKQAGARVAMTTDQTEAERLDPWLDIRVYGAGSISDEVVRHTQASGDVLAVYNGGSTGDPCPAADRFFYGVYAWATGAEGVFQWAYQWAEGDPLDDRDGATRDWCYTFPAGPAFCAPSPQWEAIGEGITDLRYLLAAERALPSGGRRGAALQSVLSEVRAEVTAFLRTNTHSRYAETVSTQPGPDPYALLSSQFPYERLNQIRRKLQDALQDVGA